MSGTKSAVLVELEGTVRRNLVCVLGACLITMSAMAWTGAQQVEPAGVPAASMDEVLRAVLGTKLAVRRDADRPTAVVGASGLRHVEDSTRLLDSNPS